MLKKLALAAALLGCASISHAERYVVEIAPGKTIKELSERFNLPPGLFKQMGTGKRYVVDLEIDSSRVTDLIELLPEVETIELDVAVQPYYTPNDEFLTQQYALFSDAAGIDALEAYDITEGQGSVISVIDTGYVPHPDLDANRLSGYDFVSNATNARDGDGRDPDAFDEGDWTSLGQCGASSNSSWHGTHVSGITSGVTNNGIGIAGGAGKSKFVPVRALASCGGSLIDIADAVVWSAGGNVPGTTPNQNPADVINMSLGGVSTGCPNYMQDAIDFAVSQGSVVVVAAGNESRDASGAVPANCDNVITVASVGEDGGRASYSNFGNNVDIAAPGGGNGRGVLSTLDSGSRAPEGPTYASYQGTSMATPYVAAVAAMVKSLDKSLTHSEVEELLKKTSRGFSASCIGCGSGVVNALNAVTAIGGTPVEDPSEDPVEEPAPEPVETEVQYGGSKNVAIADARRFLFFTSTSTTRTSVPTASQGTDVLAYVIINHENHGDLGITMTTPDGSTRNVSVLAQSGSRVAYGVSYTEQPSGQYTINVTDRRSGGRGVIESMFVLQVELK